MFGAILWGAIELVSIILFARKKLIFQNENIDVEEKKDNIRKKWIGIFVLIAIICGWRTSGMVQSTLDCIKVLLIYVAFSIAMMTDLEAFIIPNILSIGLLVGRVLIFIPEFIVRGSDAKAFLFESIVGGIISLVLLLIVSLITKGGFGMGDVKILSAEGFMIGLYGVINTLLYALIVCAICALILLAMHKKKLKDKLPFAPFIYAGFVICLLMGGF